ncbi:glycosyltransferase family 69 protein [Rhodotorula graminis WP1]|uniref:Glycosyltransferase family 69 protein n=1 Tax=Rhodotorula graminis (strain WP1) TaxID=578459 RepID=A0A194SAQ9_RHOGW|nr:glycosyltransferase family 69 protein [Rhodotorula graminis WP1]KPV77808.1 glycosyltransferase family 69 protein [Rhodotorula graminis WP1]
MWLPWTASGARHEASGPRRSYTASPAPSHLPPSSSPAASAASRGMWDRLSLDSTADIPPDTPLLFAHEPKHDPPSSSAFPSRRSSPTTPPLHHHNDQPHTALDLGNPTAPSSPRHYASTLRTHRRKHRLASLAYSSALVCLAASTLLACAVVGWSAHFVYTRHAALATAVFAPPLEPRPVSVEWAAPPFPPSGAAQAQAAAKPDHAAGRDGVDQVERELDRRYVDELGLPSTTGDLRCASVVDSAALSRRYDGLRAPPSGVTSSTTKTLVALNLYNSELVIPALSHALLAVASFLGPANVHISIFENGSTDRTVAALAHLARALSALGADHDVVSDPRTTDWKKVDRIDQLAVFRNLLFQRRVQGADAACAMDWRANKGPGHWWRDSILYYDSWVGRSLSGQMMRPRTDLFQEWHDGVDGLFNAEGDEASKARFTRGLPTPVYSCWNGMLALDARPFTSTAPAPRYDPASTLSTSARKSWRRPPPASALEPAKFRSALNREGECAASECKTLAKDFWTRGYDRWLVVPSVHVTYDAAVYNHPRLWQLASLHPPSLSNLTLTSSSALDSPPPPSRADGDVDDDEPSELIPWATLSPPDTVVCWAWVRGFHLDLEWVRATWFRPYAFARSLLDVGGGPRRA